MKFLVNHPAIKSGTKSFGSEGDAEGDFFAEALFALPGVRSIYVNQDYISVTKSIMEDWTDLVEPIRDIIETHLRGYEAGEDSQANTKPAEKVSITPEEFNNMDNDEKTLIVDALLDESVRPALAADGGGLIVQAVEDHIVRIHYQGACGSCPSSTEGTLRAIQGILQQSLGPEIRVHTAII
tara:strand:- start:386 stop:931 length:546 start_codon:yes stop_codon:yes gene_type:complete